MKKNPFMDRIINPATGEIVCQQLEINRILFEHYHPKFNKNTQKITHNTQPDGTYNFKQIQAAIKRIKQNKAWAWDLIPDKLLSIAEKCNETAQGLANLINDMIVNKKLPNDINIARLIIFNKLTTFPARKIQGRQRHKECSPN